MTHRYYAQCSWRGTTGVGYENYNRDHVMAAPPTAASIELSGDPAFRGNPARINPEQLLVIAASSCQLLSFLALAARARVDVLSYEDSAEGEMPEGEKPARITRIILRPHITVAAGTDEARVRALIVKGHEECYIANSLKTDIEISASIAFG